MRLLQKNRFIFAILIIGLIAALGTYVFGNSHAATNVVSVEAENGTLTNGVTQVNDASASGAKTIKYGLGAASQPSGTKCSSLTNLAFCDDFDGAVNTAPDSSKWRVMGGSSWGGQCFKNLRENIGLDGQGNMKMTLLNKGTNQCTDSDGYPSNISSGGMDTDGKQYFQHGTFEIRAKLACAQSVWGAIWLATGDGPAWPQSGEIDIYEMFHNDIDTIKNSIHSGNPHYSIGRTYTMSKPFCQDFHVYGVIWRQGSIKYTVDGVVVNEYTKADAAGRPWPFDTYNERLLIDLQYGGPGRPNAGVYDIRELPDSMLVDYVHIYK